MSPVNETLDYDYQHQDKVLTKFGASEMTRVESQKAMKCVLYRKCMYM